MDFQLLKTVKLIHYVFSYHLQVAGQRYFAHVALYSLKVLLREESPRDYADDFASGLASHMNVNRLPARVPFSPHEGRLSDPTPENLRKANEGELHVELPWLSEKKNPSDVNGHPYTGSKDHYALSDRFHEGKLQESQRRSAT